MIYLKTRKALLMFIWAAFGVFFTLSCSQFNKTSSGNGSEFSIDRSLDKLEQINSQLSNEPNNRDLQLEKAELLYSISVATSAPVHRKPYYQNLRDLAETQKQASQEVQPELKYILAKAWSSEQGDGIRLLQQDRSEYLDQQFETIVAHFENAIAINPDSLVTYNLLANTFYRHGDLNDAITTLETASAISGDVNPDIGEKLAYLYLESGDIEKSIQLYSNLKTENSQSPHIRNGLANAYILNQQHEEAVEVLRLLTEDYPTRFEYKEALATELYFLMSEKADRASQPNLEEQIAASELESLIGIVNEIDELFETLKENLPFNEEQLVRSGAFYHNTSVNLSKLKSNAGLRFQNELEIKRVEMLEKALPLWEKLSENHPGNIDYIRNLHDIYVKLGRDEDAENLQRSFNL
jgi:predicted Zn-dependent protease